jgi:hypothetical protein
MRLEHKNEVSTFWFVVALVLAAPAAQGQEAESSACTDVTSARTVLAGDEQALQDIKREVDALDSKWNEEIDALKKRLQAKSPAIRREAARITNSGMSAYIQEAMSLLQSQLAAAAEQHKAERESDVASSCRWALEKQARFRSATEVHDRFYRRLSDQLEALLAGASK